MPPEVCHRDERAGCGGRPRPEGSRLVHGRESGSRRRRRAGLHHRPGTPRSDRADSPYCAVWNISFPTSSRERTASPSRKSNPRRNGMVVHWMRFAKTPSIWMPGGRRPASRRCRPSTRPKRRKPNLRRIPGTGFRIPPGGRRARADRETARIRLGAGIPPGRCCHRSARTRAAQKFLRHDEEALRELTTQRKETGYLGAVRRRIEELERMLQADRTEPDLNRDAGWDAESLRADFNPNR